MARLPPVQQNSGIAVFTLVDQREFANKQRDFETLRDRSAAVPAL